MKADDIYIRKTHARKDFVTSAFERFEIEKRLVGAKRLLIKPNLVSHEPYPTTTHPDVLDACLGYFQKKGIETAVADGPAFDAGPSAKIIDGHPLKQVCRSYHVPFIDLLEGEMIKMKGKEVEFELSGIVLEYDFILSLPVLKSHFICSLSGALKNQFGFLSSEERIRLHLGRTLHSAIAELNLIVRPDFFIVDAVETLTGAQEVRHGGRHASLGYMMAGSDPVALDTAGLDLLKGVDHDLAGKGPSDIPHLRHAIALGLGRK